MVSKSSEIQQPASKSAKISNFIAGKDYRRQLGDVAHEVAERLSIHCGPFARNAVIPTSISATTDDRVDRFTKDGISIAKSMRSDDVLAQYFSRLVTHVGEEVDTVCHDGTTTSMLTFSLIVANVSHKLSQTFNPIGAPIISKCVAEMLEEVRTYIDSCKMTIDELVTFVQKARPEFSREDVTRCLAYHEALISSKGDIKLADAISRVVASLPDELFGFYSIEQEKFETDEIYRVSERDYDVGFSSNTPPVFLNHELNTELLLPSCDLIVSQIDLALHSPLSNFLCAAIIADSKVVEEINKTNPDYLGRLYAKPEYALQQFGLSGKRTLFTRPVLVVSPTMITCPVLSTLVEIWNKVHPKKKIVTTTSQSDTLLRQAFAGAINGIAGTIPMEFLLDQGKSPLKGIIRNVYAHASGHFLKLRGLYKKTGSKYHPYYTNPKAHPFYTDTLGTLRSLIINESKYHVGKFTNDQIKQLISLYRMMTCQTVYDLKVGGTTHETVAARDVVVDSFGAAISVLTDGFVLGGYPKISTYLQEKYTKDSPTKSTIDSTVRMAIAEAFEEVCLIIFAGHETFHPTTGSVHDKTSFLLPTLQGEEIEVTKHDIGESMDIFTAPVDLAQMTDKDRIECLSGNRHPILFQPYKGFAEQIRRFNAILPNLLSSSVFINI